MMMKRKPLMTAVLAGALVGAFAVPMVLANGTDDSPPFGQEDDVAYADRLWQALNEVNLAGANAILTVPYEGQHPHGAVLQTLYYDLELEGHTGPVIVKRNYGGEGVSKEAVANDPDQYLGAVTVMYQREEGYASEHNDWFWAKYNPDGALDKSPEDVPLAGRVAGCIGCHSSAGGDDMVFSNDRYAQ